MTSTTFHPTELSLSNARAWYKMACSNARRSGRSFDNESVTMAKTAYWQRAGFFEKFARTYFRDPSGDRLWSINDFRFWRGASFVLSAGVPAAAIGLFYDTAVHWLSTIRIAVWTVSG